MDANHSSIGKSDEQTIWSLSSDDQWGCTSSVRSYTCAFCKKGFSNAQALGGHMNIHRRDRAKLRESIDETKSINPPHDHRPLPDLVSDQDKNPFPSESVEEGSRIPKSPYSLSLGDSADKKDLPFSLDSKMSNFLDGDDDDDNKLKLSQRSIQTELDLELRLGPEPHEISSSSSTRNTRGFF